MGKRVLGLLVAGIIIGLACFFAGRKMTDKNEGVASSNVTVKTIRDTTLVRDTIFVALPPYSEERELGQRELIVSKETVSMINDNQDSVKVELPEVSRRYEGEEYELWISGIEPKLDSISIFRTESSIVEREIVTVNTPKTNNRRWSIGISAGMGYANGRIGPYIGVGVCYRLF